MNSFPFSAGAEGEEVHQHADGTVSKTLHTPWVYVEPDGTAHLAPPFPPFIKNKSHTAGGRRGYDGVLHYAHRH